jgi:hypothetical protein
MWQESLGCRGYLRWTHYHHRCREGRFPEDVRTATFGIFEIHEVMPSVSPFQQEGPTGLYLIAVIPDDPSLFWLPNNSNNESVRFNFTNKTFRFI